MKTRHISPVAFVKTPDMLYAVSGIDANAPDVQDQLSALLKLDKAAVDAGFSLGMPTLEKQSVLRVVEVEDDSREKKERDAVDRETRSPGSAIVEGRQGIERFYKEVPPTPSRTNSMIKKENEDKGAPPTFESLIPRKRS